MLRDEDGEFLNMTQPPKGYVWQSESLEDGDRVIQIDNAVLFEIEKQMLNRVYRKFLKRENQIGFPDTYY